MQYSKLCTKQLFIPYLDCELSKSPQDIVEFIGDFQKIIPTADCGVILVYAQANGGWITRKFTLELEEVDGEKQSDGGEKQSCGIEKQSGGIEKQSGGIEKQSCGIEKQSGNIKKQSGGGEKFVVANILEEEEFDFD